MMVKRKKEKVVGNYIYNEDEEIVGKVKRLDDFNKDKKEEKK